MKASILIDTPENELLEMLEDQKDKLNSKKMKILKKDQKIKEEAMPLLHDLYGKLSREEKIAFLNRHKKSFMAEFTCRACLTYCKKLKFCIHTNCTGLCDSCLAKNGDNVSCLRTKTGKRVPNLSRG